MFFNNTLLVILSATCLTVTDIQPMAPAPETTTRPTIDKNGIFEDTETNAREARKIKRNKEMTKNSYGYIKKTSAIKNLVTITDRLDGLRKEIDYIEDIASAMQEKINKHSQHCSTCNRSAKTHTNLRKLVYTQIVPTPEAIMSGIAHGQKFDHYEDVIVNEAKLQCEVDLLQKKIGLAVTESRNKPQTGLLSRLFARLF